MDGTNLVISSSKTSSFVRNTATLFILTISMWGCTTMRSSQMNNENGGAIGNVIKDDKAYENKNGTNSENKGMAYSAPYVLNEPVFGLKLKVNQFDYPVVSNDAVEKWISYFTGKGRRYFSKYLERGRYFIPEIAKVLKQNNMPQDLVYLAMIESGFNNSARSHASAVGPWQFIKSTGKIFGLNINYWVDERRDTRKATMAAINYLRNLYQEFGSWELAAASYNAGENKLRRGIAKYKTHDFWEIAKHRFLRHETRDYVPKIMAAAIITKNPELFGFEDPFQKGDKPISNPTLIIASDTNNNGVEDSTEPTPKELEAEIAKTEEKDEVSEDAVEVNDKLASEDTEDDIEDTEDEVNDEDHAILSKTPMPTLTPSLYMVANPNEQIIEFELKGMSDMLNVAKAAGIPYSTIKLLNPELLRWVTPPYLKSYTIKLPLSAKDRFLSTYNDENFDRKVVFQQITIKRGDNLQKIAKKHQVEIDAIREINNLSKTTVFLNPGVNINLPLPTGYKRVIASMYDEKPSVSKRKYRKRRRSMRARVRLKNSMSTGYNRKFTDSPERIIVSGMKKRVQPNLKIIKKNSSQIQSKNKNR